MIREKKENLITRPPVVVILGHIDHGKCVGSKTLIPLSNGEILNIEEIWERYTQNSNIQYIKENGKEGWIAKPDKKLKVFSFDGEKVMPQSVSHIWKLKAPSNLIKVTLSSGDEITVTPEHLFFVLTPNGKIEQKRADLIEKRDFLIVPQKLKFSIPVIKQRIIWKLDNLDDLTIFFKKKRGKEFLKRLEKVNKQELYRKGLFSTQPYNFIREEKFRARDFVKIGKSLRFSFPQLYEIVHSIKNANKKKRWDKTNNKIRLPKIPKDLKKLGYLVGCLVGDGQTKNGILYNSNPKIQSTFRRYLKNVFGLDAKISKTKTSWKIESSGYKTLTRFLTDVLDFPRYKKSKNINFPQVFYGSLDFIKGFIGGWFDTDGYVSPINYSVEFSSKSEDLIKKISILLLYFGIHSTVYKTKKKSPQFKRRKTYYCLRIANDPYLKRFLNYFPIKHGEKKRKIQTAITKSSESPIFDLTPISGQNLRSFYINEHFLPYFTHHRKYKFLSRYFLRKLLKWANKISLPKIFVEPGVKNLINPEEISCVKVRKIEYLKNKHEFVYDLTVPHFHNFIAERIFVHNTTILDYIRKTHVAEKEAGGITQHIGAYQIEKGGKKITFIDTPGHEAFSAMRSRGVKLADIAILVIDSCEGVKLQTKEAISHLKKLQIPIIVALNKIDKPEANPEKVKRELQKEEILVESMGGKIPAVNISAKTGENIEELLELISLISEMEELKTDLKKPGKGTVIEAYLDKRRGPTATLILNQGKLRPGQIVGTSSTLGKVKALEDFQGIPISEALPSQPVIVLGFEAVPRVGEEFKVFPDIKEARTNLKPRKEREPEVITIEPDQKVFNLILKADVLGSLEAIEEVLKNLPQEKIILRILKSEVGEVTESDIKMALQAKAKILGFRVKINPAARVLLEREKIKIMQFEVIYDLVEGVRKLMERLVEPELIRTDLGKVKTLVIFRTEKNRQIVGGRVTEGEVKKGVLIEILRNEEVIGRGKLINLQINKKDVDKALKGQECGILYEGEVKIEVGDTLVIYQEEKRKGEL